MRNGKLGMAMAALATVMLTASLALARPGGGPGSGPGGAGGPGYGPCGGGGAGMISQLPPEKQEAYKKLFEAYYNKTAQVRAAIGVKKAELNALAVSPNPDTAKIEALSKEIGDLHGKLVAERTEFRVQVSKEIGPLASGCLGFGGRGMGGRGMMGGCQ